jgi:hypothetical protein
VKHNNYPTIAWSGRNIPAVEVWKEAASTNDRMIHRGSNVRAGNVPQSSSSFTNEKSRGNFRLFVDSILPLGPRRDQSGVVGSQSRRRTSCHLVPQGVRWSIKMSTFQRTGGNTMIYKGSAADM